MARLPFSEETIDRFLPLLDDTVFVKELGEELKNAFKVLSFLSSVKYRKPIQNPMEERIIPARQGLRQEDVREPTLRHAWTDLQPPRGSQNKEVSLSAGSHACSVHG